MSTPPPDANPPNKDPTTDFDDQLAALQWHHARRQQLLNEAPVGPPDPAEDDADSDSTEAAMAAQMGFSTFGTQDRGSKRQKRSHARGPGDDAVVAGTGANASAIATSGGRGGNRASAWPRKLEQREPSAASFREGDVGGRGGLPTTADLPEEKYDEQGRWVPSEAELRLYAGGVVRENGDVAYFMPSFIEDPWAEKT